MAKMSPMHPERVLVSGATGFLGQAITTAIRAKWPGARVAGLYIGEPKPGADVEAIEADIRDLKAEDVRCIREFDPDTLYHIAGVARGDAETLYGVNVGGTAHLLAALVDAPSMQRVILAASTSVYGCVADSELPVTEDQRLEPANEYAISKLAQELLVQEWCRQNNWIALICRITNPIGPGQSDAFFVGRLVRQFAELTADDPKARLEVWHLAGSRDFIDTRDLAAAFVRLAMVSEDAVINVGSGEETDLSEVADALQSLIGKEVELVETREIDASQILRQHVDISRLQQRIGRLERRSLRETLADMLEAAGCESG